MNTTSETSELNSPKTNMAPTTTFAKSKKGVIVLVALCMLFFYTGRLSSSTSSGGGASLEAALLRGFQHDVVITATTETQRKCDPNICRNTNCDRSTRCQGCPICRN